MSDAAHSHVLVLVSPRHARVEPADVQAAIEALRAAGASPGDAVSSAQGREIDVPVSGDAVTLDRAVRGALAGRRIDLAILPAANRRKRLLVIDLESTVIENEMLDELALEVGVGDRVAAITARAMNGELDFRAALAERLALLRGVDAGVVERVRARIRLDPGAQDLVAGMRGGTTALVSGGFDVFARPIAERLGFDVVHANQLEIRDGRLTGRVVEPVLDRDAKLRILDDQARTLGLTREDVVAVGDGANDLPMLLAAGLGVAYHAKPTVAAAARFRVDHGDLSSVLGFLGRLA